MTDTAFGQAFRKAKVGTGKARLYSRAVELLRDAKGNPYVASQSFIEAVLADKEMLRALVDDAALSYLKAVKEDMDGSALADADAGGGGQRSSDIQSSTASAAPHETGSNAVADENGHRAPGSQSPIAPSSAPHSKTPAKPVGGGHHRSDAQFRDVSPSPQTPSRDGFTTVREHPRRLPSADPAVWSKDDIKRNARGPHKERVSAEQQLKTKNMVAASILDTLIVRGKPIGKWRKEEAQELSEKLSWDAMVLKAFTDPLPPGAMVEEYITVTEAQQIMKRLEASRYAA